MLLKENNYSLKSSCIIKIKVVNEIIRISHMYDFQVGLGYVLLLNFFGKGNKTLIPKTIKNKNNMNNKINDISGFSSPIKLIIKDDINIKAKDINPYLALKA